MTILMEDTLKNEIPQSHSVHPYNYINKQF